MRQLPEYYSDETQRLPAVQIKKHRRVHWRLMWDVFIALIQLALLCAIFGFLLWAVMNVQIAR